MAVPQGDAAGDSVVDRGSQAMLGRIERRAGWFTGVAAVFAAVSPGGGLHLAAAVVSGAFLAGVSYLAIKRGVMNLTAGGARRRAGFVGFILRHALLAGIAYVMIARLRLSPIGLLSGASVTMLAAAAEAATRRP